MTKTLLLGAAAAAALTTIPNFWAADFSQSDLVNRAVASSPRALEQFPWLARQALPVLSAQRAGSPVWALQGNSTRPVSPRMLEQFPELARAAKQPGVVSGDWGTAVSQLSEVTANRALAASPRTVEQFPWLARGYKSQPAKQSFEVAPIK